MAARPADTEHVTVKLGAMAPFARKLLEGGRHGSLDDIVQAGLAALEDAQAWEHDAVFEAVVKAKVEEALADPRPPISADEAFRRAHEAIAERARSA